MCNDSDKGYDLTTLIRLGYLSCGPMFHRARSAQLRPYNQLVLQCLYQMPSSTLLLLSSLISKRRRNSDRDDEERVSLAGHKVAEHEDSSINDTTVEEEEDSYHCGGRPVYNFVSAVIWHYMTVV